MSLEPSKSFVESSKRNALMLNFDIRLVKPEAETHITYGRPLIHRTVSIEMALVRAHYIWGNILCSNRKLMHRLNCATYKTFSPLE